MRRQSLRSSAVLVAIVLCLIPLACGGSGGDDEGRGHEDQAVVDPQVIAEREEEGKPPKAFSVYFEVDSTGLFKFTKKEETAEAGIVRLYLENPQDIAHDVALENSKGEEIGGTEAVARGATGQISLELEAGTYTYYCTIPGHREQGMEGTLTVE